MRLESRMGRSGRLLQIVTLLEGSPGLKAADLAEACHVSERTISRDLSALTRMGVAVCFNRGYAVSRARVLPPLLLRADEALALKASAALRLQEAGRAQPDGPLAASLRTARDKLDLALRIQAQPAAEGRQLPLDLAVPVADGEGGVLPVLGEGIIRSRTVTLVEGRGQGRSRPFDPYGLTLRRGAWHVVGYSHQRRRVLLIPVDRIRSATLTGRRFRPRRGHRASRLLGDMLPAARPPLHVRIRFAASLAPTLRPQGLPWVHSWEPGPDGEAIASLVGAEGDELIAWLLPFGEGAEVLDPPVIRQRIARLVEDLAARYRRPPRP